MNVGEEICGEWLRWVKGCDFVQYNLKTQTVQGEIDVIGIDLTNKIVYACEVAIHLVTGLQYTKNAQPNNVDLLVTKFRKDIEYIRSSFPDYEHQLMFWSPIVKNQKPGSKHNQQRDVELIVRSIHEEYGVEIKSMINNQFQSALDDLRAVAAGETKALEGNVLRYLQIEERLNKHLTK